VTDGHIEQTGKNPMSSSQHTAGSEGRILARNEGGVATVTISSPSRRNAFTMAMLQDFRRAVEAQLADPACHVLVLRGAGGFFCAGGDINDFRAMLHLDSLARLHTFRVMIENWVNPVILALRAAHQPVVAVVQGACAGYGLSLALASDCVIASDDAVLSTAYAGIALPCDGGQSLLLTRAIGERRARELMWSARRVDAHEAHALGLIEQVVTEEELDAAVAAHVARLAHGPRHALAEIKRLLTGPAEVLATQLAAEAQAFARCAATMDFVEGVTAFAERRPPVFQGR
jgi:2-(1,2-epoxy-1,2-dihydrophenyl)acetyl-CoA isomerase